MKKKARIYSSSESDSWVSSNSYERDTLNPGISTHTIELQLFLDTFTPSYENLPKEDRSWWKEMLRTNKTYGNHMINMLNKNAKQLGVLTKLL